MRIWFDTEFIEDGKTIDLLSIGMVREDGEIYYAESAEADHSRAGDWVKANVLTNMLGGVNVKSRAQIAKEIIEFAGAGPEFWAYYADYDWVVLCQLFGTMMDLPRGWPMYCRDLKQAADERGNPTLPDQNTTEHFALNDACWAKRATLWLETSGPSNERGKALSTTGDGMREALTPSRETKIAYAGEFKFSIYETDENGDEWPRMVTVPWTTIKEIMAKIAARAALSTKQEGEECLRVATQPSDEHSTPGIDDGA